MVRYLTVGRQSEIARLESQLTGPDGTVLLVSANYGSGKTHLLRLVRELALAAGFVVSLVTLDANSAIRFNRMDQIFGALCRNLEIPNRPGEKGIRPFFRWLEDQAGARGQSAFWKELSNDWRWRLSDTLESRALFIALRAWIMGTRDTEDLVEDWLYQPWVYRTQRKKLYLELVDGLSSRFRDPRSESVFYAQDVFALHTQDYYQSWAALRDLHTLSSTGGFKGLVLLFDEFEDILTNLHNVAYQESAFRNLFQFYSGKLYPGKTFYAVTPAFVQKCKYRLHDKERWDFDYERFDELPTFEMSPLETVHLMELAGRIVAVHELAYGWESSRALGTVRLTEIVHTAARAQIQDRTRFAITSVVSELDRLMPD
jgi:hypothetical protein